jgi:superfamily I DNA/RNA helicase/Zn-dependent peptidase ImmA (M78 family)
MPMDPFEVSRQRAEKLHTDAVQTRGRNPWNPYAFAVAEAARRRIAVEKASKGDVRLFGAKAHYDPGSLLILHEETGDAFTNAFLVAHEIGHVELEEGGTPSAIFNFDILRSAGAEIVDEDRVGDYNRRQRREVQMDLFAREFLLPRPWVRKLHLEDGASAAAIATQLGAPHPVVAQQLLDALLLPRVNIREEDGRPDRPLKPDQNAAATHEGTPFLLEAGPGTGKTQTLVGRIDFLLGKGIEPSKILILTFSNKAAGELSDRISSKHPEAAASTWIGTFHGFGLDIIRRFHEHLGLPADPRLISRTDSVEILENEYPRLNLIHFKNLWDPTRPLLEILGLISRASDEVVDSAGYKALAEAMRNAASGDEDRKSAERHIEVATAFAEYERLKKARGVIDFGDLITMPVRLCESHAEVRDYLSSHYEHILVDEYQDVNRSSVRLLKALAGDGRNLWVVGDAKQSIYRFRGASAFNMIRFDSEDFPGGTRGRLTRNYRSVSEVVDTFLTFAAEIPSVRGTDIALDSVRGKCGKAPEYRSVTTADEEIVAVAEAIEELRREGYSYRDQAILSSGNERLERFGDKLERLGIPVLYLGSLFEREEIKDLISLLSILVDRRAMGLLRAASLETHAVPLGDVVLMFAHLKANDHELMGWTNSLETLGDLTEAGREGLRRIAELLQGFPSHADPWSVLSQVLLDRTRMAADIAQADDVRARSRGVAIWQFMNFVQDQQHQGSGFAITRLLDRIRRLVLLSDDREFRQLPAAAQGIDAVRLLTMHGSKGLEFPAVHIPGLNEGSLPRSPKAAVASGSVPPDGLIDGAEGKAIDAVRAGVAEEQQCLFFVALSRARNRLFLYSPTKKSNGHAWPRSSFISRLGSGVTSRPIVPTLNLPPNPTEAPIPLSVEGTFSFTNHQLALFERCPRRFFYTHILEIGGRRTETAFMQLHVAVQNVIGSSGPRPDKSPSAEDLKRAIDEAWDQHGPATHGYGEDYKRIALQLIEYYADLISDIAAHPIPELRLPVAGGEIVITPHHVTSDAEGIVMRQVATGHKSSQDGDSLSVAAFHIAATTHSPGCRVELVHLSDSKVTPINLSPVVIANRRSSIDVMAAAVHAGRFPIVKSISCPRCPAYFICGRIPSGQMMKKFRA